MIPAPLLVAQGHPSHAFASRSMEAVAWLAIPVMIGLGFIGPGWTALAIATICGVLAGQARQRRLRWQLDAPGPDARFRFGKDASRSVRLADISGMIGVDDAGYTHTGIRVTRPYPNLWIVGHDGTLLGHASAQALAPEDWMRFGRAFHDMDFPIVSLAEAKRAGALPQGLPWYMRHLGLTIVGTVLITLAVVITILVLPSSWR